MHRRKYFPTSEKIEICQKFDKIAKLKNLSKIEKFEKNWTTFFGMLERRLRLENLTSKSFVSSSIEVIAWSHNSTATSTPFSSKFLELLHNRDEWGHPSEKFFLEITQKHAGGIWIWHFRREKHFLDSGKACVLKRKVAKIRFFP
jgi:hypothetical protein